MKKRMFMFVMMVMILAGFAPTVTEAKGKKLTVIDKTTGKTVASSENSHGVLPIPIGETHQLVVRYGKKNVTKKAKFNYENGSAKKPITMVMKKNGKITAKAKGGGILTVTYKNKTVIIYTGTTYKQYSATKRLVGSKKPRDPDCDHDWCPYFYSDTIYDEWDESLQPFTYYRNRLVLFKLQCDTCGDIALTKSVPISEVMDEEDNLIYTKEDFQKVIVGYRVCDKTPHHTHLGKQAWSYWNNRWWIDTGADTCITCGYDEL